MRFTAQYTIPKIDLGGDGEELDFNWSKLLLSFYLTFTINILDRGNEKDSLTEIMWPPKPWAASAHSITALS